MHPCLSNTNLHDTEFASTYGKHTSSSLKTVLVEPRALSSIIKSTTQSLLDPIIYLLKNLQLEQNAAAHILTMSDPCDTLDA